MSRDSGAWLRQTNPVPTLSGAAMAIGLRLLSEISLVSDVVVSTSSTGTYRALKVCGERVLGCLIRVLPYAASKQLG